MLGRTTESSTGTSKSVCIGFVSTEGLLTMVKRKSSGTCRADSRADHAAAACDIARVSADPDARARQAAAEAAAELVEPGMTIGLGSGRAVWALVELLADPARRSGRRGLRAHPGAGRGRRHRARGAGRTAGARPGARRRRRGGPELGLIKGGGGALLREKIVISAAAPLRGGGRGDASGSSAWASASGFPSRWCASPGATPAAGVLPLVAGAELRDERRRALRDRRGPPHPRLRAPAGGRSRRPGRQLEQVTGRGGARPVPRHGRAGAARAPRRHRGRARGRGSTARPPPPPPARPAALPGRPEQQPHLAREVLRRREVGRLAQRDPQRGPRIRRPAAPSGPHRRAAAPHRQQLDGLERHHGAPAAAPGSLDTSTSTREPGRRPASAAPPATPTSTARSPRRSAPGERSAPHVPEPADGDVAAARERGGRSAPARPPVHRAEPVGRRVAGGHPREAERAAPEHAPGRDVPRGDHHRHLRAHAGLHVALESVHVRGGQAAAHERQRHEQNPAPPRAHAAPGPAGPAGGPVTPPPRRPPAHLEAARRAPARRARRCRVPARVPARPRAAGPGGFRSSSRVPVGVRRAVTSSSPPPCSAALSTRLPTTCARRAAVRDHRGTAALAAGDHRRPTARARAGEARQVHRRPGLAARGCAPRAAAEVGEPAHAAARAAPRPPPRARPAPGPGPSARRPGRAR